MTRKRSKRKILDFVSLTSSVQGNKGLEDRFKLLAHQEKIINEIFKLLERDFLVVGGFGSGKTTLGAGFILRGLRFPRTISLISRLDLREIENTILPKIFEMASSEEADYMYRNWNKNLQRIEHPSGSLLFYLSLEERGGHYRKLRSYEFNFALVDEASEVVYDAFQEVLLRTRRAPLQKVLLLSNAVPKTHWLYEYFVEKGSGKVYKISSWDNPFLPESYKKLLSLYPPELQKVVAEAEWGDISFAKTFLLLDLSHIAIEDEVLTKEDIYFLVKTGKVLISADWGINHSAFVLGFIDFFNRLHIAEEFEYQNIPLPSLLEDLDKKIREKWGVRIQDCVWVGDISGKQKGFYGDSIFQYMLQKGIYVWAEYSTIEEGLKILQAILCEKIEIEWEGRKTGRIRREKRPILIFYPNCVRSLEALQKAYKVSSESDKIEKKEDVSHIADAIRYLARYYYKFYLQGKTEIISPFV